jgi:hypothetical protein
MLLVRSESYESGGVHQGAFVKLIPMVQEYWTIWSKNIQQNQKRCF